MQLETDLRMHLFAHWRCQKNVGVARLAALNDEHHQRR